jgi:serine/threonine protein kinase
MAPEVLTQGRVTPKSDVYSFGVLSECAHRSFGWRARCVCVCHVNARGAAPARGAHSGRWVQRLPTTVATHNAPLSLPLPPPPTPPPTHPPTRTHTARDAVWEVFTGRQAWRGLHPGAIIQEVVVGRARPPAPARGMPEEYKLLMERCWAEEPAQRPEFEQARARPCVCVCVCVCVALLLCCQGRSRVLHIARELRPPSAHACAWRG